MKPNKVHKLNNPMTLLRREDSTYSNIKQKYLRGEWITCKATKRQLCVKRGTNSIFHEITLRLSRYRGKQVNTHSECDDGSSVTDWLLLGKNIEFPFS